MQPRAIETRYQGYRFRSRTEARWACFFDRLGLSWDYEPEGFELPGGVRYLPDFKIGNAWFEVKPPGEPAEKARLFQEKIGEPVFVLDGKPDLRAYLSAKGGANMIFLPKWHDHAPYFFETGMCDRRAFPVDDFFDVVDALRAAVDAARSARFEHGESGAR
jgi:hypothetical protein